MCYKEGILQAYLDEEVTVLEKTKIEKHLSSCQGCRDALKSLEDNNNFVNLHLTTYSKQVERLEPVNDRFFCESFGYMELDLPQLQVDKKNGVFALLKKYKKIIASAAVVACFGVSLSFAPVREAAAEFLTLFRVQKIETTSISIQDLNQIQQAFYNKGVDLNIENFGKVENKQDGERRQVSWDEAEGFTGFGVKRPTYMPAGLQLNEYPNLEPANKIEFTLNVKNVNDVIKQLGGNNLIPADLEGKPFSLSIAPSLHVTAHSGEGQNSKALGLTQTLSPEMKLPGGVDAGEVRRAILDLPVIPVDVKNKLASLEDWHNTLYIPQPQNGTTEKVSIGGAQGVIVSDKWKDNRFNNMLMWQEKGMLYILNGYNIEKEEVIRIAESLK